MQIVQRRLAHGVRPPEVGIGYLQARVFVRGKCNLVVFTGRKTDTLFKLNIWFPLPRNSSLEHAAGRLRRKVAQICINREAGCRLRQGKLSVDQRIFDRNISGRSQVNRLPNSCISVRYKRDAKQMWSGELTVVSKVFRVDPIEPTIRQLHAIDILNQLFRA